MIGYAIVFRRLFAARRLWLAAPPPTTAGVVEPVPKEGGAAVVPNENKDGVVLSGAVASDGCFEPNENAGVLSRLVGSIVSLIVVVVVVVIPPNEKAGLEWVSIVTGLESFIAVPVDPNGIIVEFPLLAASARADPNEKGFESSFRIVVVLVVDGRRGGVGSSTVILGLLRLNSWTSCSSRSLRLLISLVIYLLVYLWLFGTVRFRVAGNVIRLKGGARRDECFISGRSLRMPRWRAYRDDNESIGIDGLALLLLLLLLSSSLS